MATIRDVAQHAGVSIATVSRVINGSGSVSQELRTLVYKSMQELHFHPNAVARSLKVASTMTIGMIVLDLSNHQLARLCYSISSRLYKNNYLPLVCSSDSNSETEQKYMNHLLSHQVDGIILNSCQPWNPQIAKISQSIPMVTVYRRIESPDFTGDFIDSDGTAGTYALSRHLLEHGHRDIFIINGPLNTSAGFDRYQGFRQAMEEYGIQVDDSYPYQLETNYTQADGVRAIKYIQAMEHRPTAIITTNPETQLGVLSYCKEQGIRIPEDYSLVSYASASNDDLFYIRPTCAVQDYRVIGLRAGELILERIANPNLPNREIIYPCPIIYGNTVKPVLS